MRSTFERSGAESLLGPGDDGFAGLSSIVDGLMSVASERRAKISAEHLEEEALENFCTQDALVWTRRQRCMSGMAIAVALGERAAHPHAHEVQTPRERVSALWNLEVPQTTGSTTMQRGEHKFAYLTL